MSGWLVGFTAYQPFPGHLKPNKTSSRVFVYEQLNVKTVLFQTIQMSIKTQFNSI